MRLESISQESVSSPLLIEWEFTRTDSAGDPFAFRCMAQTYLLRTKNGGFQSAPLAWDEAMLEDLNAIRAPDCAPIVVQRMGERLRRFLEPLGLPQAEEAIVAAVMNERKVIITIRSAAAELYALPWELVTLRGNGQFLGELPNVLLRYEWPRSQSTPIAKGAPSAERILFAWSAAGGSIPGEDHQLAITLSCEKAGIPFDHDTDVLPLASCKKLRSVLSIAEQTDRPIRILHLLCHGGVRDGSFGLILDSDEAGDRPIVATADILRRRLSPFSDTLRLVVLMACDGGGIGPLGNELGSVAQSLHHMGYLTVIASRYPLGVSASIEFSQSFYQQLLGELCSVEDAFLAGRSALAQDASHRDFATLQMYSRAADGIDTRPLSFRPYRGLHPYDVVHRHLFFGRALEQKRIVQCMDKLTRAGKPRLVVIAGAYGSGKTSLALAAVAPALQGRLPKGALTLVLRPGQDPLSAWAHTCSLLPPAAAAVIVVDQLEELFTNASDSETAQQVGSEFLTKVCALASSASPTRQVILAIRSDFLSRCGELVCGPDDQGFDAILADDSHCVSLAQLEAAQLRLVIEEPACKVGLRLQPGLTERLLADVAEAPRPLPLLSDTLDALWLRRKDRQLWQVDYDELGGVAAALANHAERFFAEQSEEDRLLLRRLLVRLTSQSEGPRTRQRLSQAALLPHDADQQEQYLRVMELLVSAGLIVRRQSAGLPTLEIAHDALLQSWKRLRQWCDEDQDVVRQLLRLNQWASDFREHGTLLNGAQLGYAQTVEAEHSELLPEAVMQLLQASQTEQERLEELARRARDAARVLAAQSVAHDPSRVLAILREVESKNPERVPEWLGRVTTLLQTGTFLHAELAGPIGDVTHCAFDSDAELCVIASGDGTVDLCRVKSGEHLAQRALQATVNGLGFSYAYDLLLVATESGLYVLSLPRCEIIDVIETDMDVRIDCTRLDVGEFVTISDGIVKLWCLQSLAAPVWSLDPESAHGELVCAVQHPTEPWIVLGYDDGTLVLHEREGDEDEDGRVLFQAEEGVRFAQFSSDGARLFVCFADGSLRTYSHQELADGEEGQSIAHQAEDIVCWAVAPSGQRIALGCEDGSISLLQLQEEDDDWSEETLSGHDRKVNGLVFAADSDRLASASNDQRVALWSMDDLVLPRFLDGHQHTVNALSFDPDARWLLTGSSDCTARIWNVESPPPYEAKPCAELPEPDSEPFWLLAHDWSADAPDQTVRLHVRSHDGRFRTQLDDDDNWVLLCDDKQTKTLGSSDDVSALALDPDGGRLLVCTQDRRVVLHNLEDDTQQRLSAQAHEEAYSASVSSSGAVATTENWTLRLWSASAVNNKAEPMRLRHGAALTLLSFAPEDDALLSATWDPGAFLWNEAGQRVTWLEPARELNLRAVLPDHSAWITSDSAGNLREWPLERNAAVLIERMWAASRFCLSATERQQVLGETPEEATARAQAAQDKIKSASAGPENNPS